MAIIEARVRPERAKLTKNDIGRKRAKYWWQFGSLAKELYAAISGLERVLVAARTTKHLAFVFLRPNQVFSENTVVFPFANSAPLAVLQSRVHEIWVRFTSSTFKDDLGYRPSDCFETFPFPERWETNPVLDAVGETYHTVRAALLFRKDEGLTKTYNRFHNPDECDPDILRLRELHAAIDRAVLDAYGWKDIPTQCEFLLDYDSDEQESGDRKLPYRYRWSDDVRDEVLVRLLELNAERARAEALAGAASGPKRAGKRTAKPAAASPDLKDLFS